MKRTPLILIVAFAVAMLAGCEWWNSKPEGLVEADAIARQLAEDASARADEAVAKLEAAQAAAAALAAEIAEIQARGVNSEAEAKILEAMRSSAQAAEKAVGEIRSTAQDAKSEAEKWATLALEKTSQLARAETNGDAVLDLVNLGLTMSGLGGVAGVIGFFRKSNQFKQLVGNIAAATVSKTPKPDGAGKIITLDGAQLLTLNQGSGIERAISKIRE